MEAIITKVFSIVNTKVIIKSQRGKIPKIADKKTASVGGLCGDWRFGATGLVDLAA